MTSRLPNVRALQSGPDWEVCILAGGLSSRMGRNKARTRIGGRSLLNHVRRTAIELGVPVRVILRDILPRCGPLGGIYTALATTKAKAVLFLSCDMPFVTKVLLQSLLSKSRSGTRPVFSVSEEGAGFPFVLPQTKLNLVLQQIELRQFSIQRLATKIKALKLIVPYKSSCQLQNINTPADLAAARKCWKISRSRPEKELP